MQPSSQPARAPGTTSTVGDPNEYGKRGVKAAVPGNPSGAEPRQHKRPLTAVPERNEPIACTAPTAPATSTGFATPAAPVTPAMPSEPSMRRYAQDTTASSLRRAGSVASIRTVQSVHTSQTDESRGDESEGSKESKHSQTSEDIGWTCLSVSFEFWLLFGRVYVALYLVSQDRHGESRICDAMSMYGRDMY